MKKPADQNPATSPSSAVTDANTRAVERLAHELMASSRMSRGEVIYFLFFLLAILVLFADYCGAIALPHRVTTHRILWALIFIGALTFTLKDAACGSVYFQGIIRKAQQPRLFITVLTVKIALLIVLPALMIYFIWQDGI